MINVYGKMRSKEVTGLSFANSNNTESTAIKRELQGEFVIFFLESNRNEMYGNVIFIIPRPLAMAYMKICMQFAFRVFTCESFILIVV